MEDTMNRRTRGQLGSLCILGGWCVITDIWLAACAKPLLAPAEERSPFDRYDAVRGNYAPQFVEDKFGRRQPNLRARLSPKE